MTPLAIFSLISALGPIVTGVLQETGVVPAGFAPLITAIEAAIGQFGKAVTNPTNGQIDITAFSLLQGISAAVAVLQQADPKLNPQALAMVQALDSAVAAGLNAYTTAGKRVDYSTLLPISAVA